MIPPILTELRLEVGYPGSTPPKTQVWNRENFIDDTRALIFHHSFMSQGYRSLFSKESDWRLNPCILRIFSSARHPEAICQKGSPQRKRLVLKNRKGNGTPVAIDFCWTHSGTYRRRSFDKDWLALTAAIIFLDVHGALRVARLRTDGYAEEVLPVTKDGVSTLDSAFEDFPCGLRPTVLYSVK